MVDGRGHEVPAAPPSTPVQLLGLSGLPAVGDQLDVVQDDRSARQLVETRERLHGHRDERAAPTMADVMRRVHGGEAKELNVVIKASTQGSVDAVRRAVEQLSSEDVQVKVLHSAAGPVNESDILLASASGALVVGFETNVEPGAHSQAALHGVTVKTYDIIYNLIDDVEAAVKGLIEPEERRVVIGHANVLQVFPHGRRERIAGVRVTDGVLRRGARIRVLRRGDEVFDGAMASMRHLSETVRELANNFEGGIILDGYHEAEEGDVFEAYEIRSS
jgi:translation initiation factor IF-2